MRTFHEVSRRDDGTETAPMSTVQDEADIGPGEALSGIANNLFTSDGSSRSSSGSNTLEVVATDPGLHQYEDDQPREEGAREELVQEEEGNTELENDVLEEEESIEWGEDVTASQIEGKPSSADGSFSTPDDTPSIHNSITSSVSNRSRRFGRRQSPTPSLRPFDKRFQSRLAPSPLGTPRALSPAFLSSHSRQSSAASQLFRDSDDEITLGSPWEVVRWTRLRRLSGQAFSEIGKRNFGRPTCIAVSSSIVLGTSRGIIIVFDYHQNLKAVIGQGTKGEYFLSSGFYGTTNLTR